MMNRDSRPDITATVYMQQIESGVRQTLDAIYSELTAKPQAAVGPELCDKFGTVWYVGVLCRSVSDRIKTVGA